MAEIETKNIIETPEPEDSTVHSEPADKIMILVSSLVSGGALWLVACLVLRYKWYIGFLYFTGMSIWVILFFEYFNFSLFRTPPKKK